MPINIKPSKPRPLAKERDTGQRHPTVVPAGRRLGTGGVEPLDSSHAFFKGAFAPHREAAQKQIRRTGRGR